MTSRTLKFLTVVDESTRQCLAIEDVSAPRSISSWRSVTVWRPVSLPQMALAVAFSNPFCMTRWHSPHTKPRPPVGLRHDSTWPASARKGDAPTMSWSAAALHVGPAAGTHTGSLSRTRRLRCGYSGRSEANYRRSGGTGDGRRGVRSCGLATAVGGRINHHQRASSGFWRRGRVRSLTRETDKRGRRQP